ncbi:764_t:CDS:2, partial [Acaulospora colombiana]
LTDWRPFERANEETRQEIEKIQAQEAEEKISYMYALQLARAEAADQDVPVSPLLNRMNNIVGQDPNRRIQIVEAPRAPRNKPDDRLQRLPRGRIPAYDSDEEEDTDEEDKGERPKDEKGKDPRPNQDVVDEATLREINRLQAVDQEWEDSMRLAQQLEQEEEEQRKVLDSLKEVNKSFDCPICAEE